MEWCCFADRNDKSKGHSCLVGKHVKYFHLMSNRLTNSIAQGQIHQLILTH